MKLHNKPPAAPAAFHASFLAGCTIGGIRVALEADTGVGAAEIKAAAANMRTVAETAQRTQADATRRLQEFDRRIADVEQKAARRPGFSMPVGDGLTDTGRDLGAEVANSDALREFKAANYRGTSKVELKTTITSSNVGGALGGMVAPDRAGVQPMARRALTIRSLCKQMRTESNQVTLMLQESRTNAAAIAPENTLKGEGAMTYVEKTFPVAVIATWVPVTKQALDDAAGLQSLINTELRFNLGEREEDQLLYGNGASGNLFGLFPQATPFVAPFEVTNETPFDRLLQALAQASVANFKPSAIALNTSDAWRLRSIKDTNSRYIGGGPYEGLVNTLFEIPWVASNGIAQNDFILGDFANAAEIYDRQDATVEISDSHSDFFTRNLLALRAEQRLAFVVRDSRAFIRGTLIDTP